MVSVAGVWTAPLPIRGVMAGAIVTLSFGSLGGFSGEGRQSVPPAPAQAWGARLTIPALDSDTASYTPAAVAKADLDGDGAPDLAAAYRSDGRGTIVVRFGDPEFHASGPGGAAVPFENDVTLETLDFVPDVLLAGDFDADGLTDLAAGAFRSPSLQMLVGDGRGGFSQNIRIELEGGLTAAVAADVNRLDGLMDLVVAVEGSDGPELVVLESSSGALAAMPERVPLEAAGTSIVVAPLVGRFLNDIAVASGDTVTIVEGRDRRLHTPGTLAHAPFAFEVPLPEPAAELTLVSDALGARRLAALTAEGIPIVISAGAAEAVGAEDVSPVLPVQIAQQARVMTNRHAVDSSAFIEAHPDIQIAPGPFAAVPMRLDADALDDLVILDGTSGAGTVLLTAPAATFIVNSTLDTPDAAPGNGVCNDGTGVCTLRAAIQESNALAGADTITFALGAGTPTIAPLSPLPGITGTVSIQGNTGGATRIQLNGGSAGIFANGLLLAGGSSGSLVRAFVINRFNFSGLRIESANNTVENCWIGLDAMGGGTVAANTGSGILVTGAAATGNLIGGTTTAVRNVISRNGLSGVTFAAGASNNQVQGNYIGTNPGANLAAGNMSDGVAISGGGTNNRIGGSTATAGTPPGNVISGNAGDGVDISGAGTSGTLIEGNLIGTNGNGTTAIGNGLNGLMVQSSAASNTIGGTTAPQRNVISGNNLTATSDGIELNGAGVTSTNVFGNLIGLAANGTAGLTNGEDGVLVLLGASGNTIGAATASPGQNGGNVISGNARDGIRVQDATTSGTLIQGNFIGLQTGGAAAQRNIGSGVTISGAPGTTVGGAAATARNVISGNDSSNQYGIQVLLATADNTTIQGNYIGTDVTGTAAVPNGTAILIQEASGADVMSNQLVGGPTGTPGTPPGNVIVGTVMILGSQVRALVRGNLIGLNASGTVALGSGVGVQITFSAINNTVGGSAVTDRNVIASGVSITNASSNNSVLGNFIGTDITGMTAVGTGGFSTDSGPNFIGGSTPTPGTPPGNVIGGSVVSVQNSNGVVRGNIIGGTANGLARLTNAGGVVFGQRAGGSVIGGPAAGDRNLIVGNSATPTSAGIICVYCNSNTIQGNWIGVDITGLTPLPNSIGVKLSFDALGGTPTPTLAIGGTNPGEGNVISGNLGSGVQLFSNTPSGGTAGTLQGNLIGVAPDGVTPMGNGTYGVEVASTTSMVVGGTTGLTPGACTGSCNTIRFNGLDGVGFAGPNGFTITVRGNRISDNTGLGIDNRPTDGVTPNDGPDSFPQNFPVVTSAVYDSGSNISTVQGTLHSIASTTFTIEVFTSAASDPSGFGEGQTFRGSTTSLTDPSGNGVWSLMFAGNFANLTATATGTNRGTSEFSALFIDTDNDGYADIADNCPEISNPDQIDADFDGHGLACDCDDGNDQVFAVPAEVTDLQLTPATYQLSWDSAIPGSGPATVHDVLRGLASDLPVDGGPSETCLASGIAGNTTSSGASPAVGQSYWYLVRGRNACGNGTYGQASSGAPRTSGACP